MIRKPESKPASQQEEQESERERERDRERQKESLDHATGCRDGGRGKSGARQACRPHGSLPLSPPELMPGSTRDGVLLVVSTFNVSRISASSGPVETATRRQCSSNRPCTQSLYLSCHPVKVKERRVNPRGKNTNENYIK